MMTMAWRAARGLTVLVVFAAVAAAPSARAEEGITAKEAFKKLKTLAGEWKKQAKPGGAHEDGGTVTYRVTSNGSTVMETDFPGSDHEMISMFHLDGADLRLTHYCAVGNQPRMKLDRAKSTAETLVFTFDGGTNLDPEKDLHIHAARIHFKGDKKLESEWEAYQDGKKMHTEVFSLTR